LVTCSWLLPGSGRADEITSNGRGGGPWSDPTTWRGKKGPGPEDDVVIARQDVVLFDRNDDKVAYAETAVAAVGAVHALGLRPLGVTGALLSGTTGRASCRQLHIDPRGVLGFKPGGGKQTICVAGPVEAFGSIRLDARNQPDDRLEFRLVGRTP